MPATKKKATKKKAVKKVVKKKVVVSKVVKNSPQTTKQFLALMRMNAGRLTRTQREALTEICRIIESGKKLKTKDIGFLGLNALECSRISLIEIFGVSPNAIISWLAKGMPRNTDGSFNSQEAFKWRIQHEKTLALKQGTPLNKLEEKRMLEQIKKLELENAEKEKVSVPRDEMHDIMRTQSSELSLFLKEGFRKNLMEVAGQLGMAPSDVGKLQKVHDNFFMEMMDAWTASGKKAEAL